MKKYMGNKSKIVQRIYDEVNLLPIRKRTIFDAFSGTTNVGQFFKKNNFSVIANDINETSELLGNVYLKLNNIPQFIKLFNSDCVVIKKIKDLEKEGKFEAYKDKFIKENHNTNNPDYLLSIKDSNAFKLLVYLSFLIIPKDINDPLYKYQLVAPDFIWRNFCKDGTKSEYFNLVAKKSLISQIETLSKIMDGDKFEEIKNLLQAVYESPYKLENINTVISILEKQEINNFKINTVITKLKSLNNKKNNVGRRIFFSENHGHQIDLINNINLIWLKDGFISKDEYNYIQCALVEAVALFSNTSATYQAFYKTYRENTLQTFRLVAPEILVSNKKHYVYREDTFSLIRNIKQGYEVLYLDPPYNWRIYDSNYHLLNLISNYSELADKIIDFESGIAGAAGENRKIDRTYTNYNRRVTFENLLFQLIDSSSAKYIVLSYSDSLSNHNKNSLSSVEKIEAFFRDEKKFVKGSYKKININSKNFESRKDKKKDPIHELLFIAQKI